MREDRPPLRLCEEAPPKFELRLFVEFDPAEPVTIYSALQDAIHTTLHRLAFVRDDDLLERIGQEATAPGGPPLGLVITRTRAEVTAELLADYERRLADTEHLAHIASLDDRRGQDDEPPPLRGA